MMHFGLLLLGAFCMGAALYGWSGELSGWGWWLFGGIVFLSNAD